jgi:hypothetical protein
MEQRQANATENGGVSLASTNQRPLSSRQAATAHGKNGDEPELRPARLNLIAAAIIATQLMQVRAKTALGSATIG